MQILVERHAKSTIKGVPARCMHWVISGFILSFCKCLTRRDAKQIRWVSCNNQERKDTLLDEEKCINKIKQILFTRFKKKKFSQLYWHLDNLLLLFFKTKKKIDENQTTNHSKRNDKCLQNLARRRKLNFEFKQAILTWIEGWRYHSVGQSRAENTRNLHKALQQQCKHVDECMRVFLCFYVRV